MLSVATIFLTRFANDQVQAFPPAHPAPSLYRTRDDIDIRGVPKAKNKPYGDHSPL